MTGPKRLWLAVGLLWIAPLGFLILFYFYPLGSIFLFLPFGLLLQSGISQVFVFKMEIAVFILFSHLSMYYFLERFWKQKMFPFIKLLGIYTLYVALIVYSANGMFDSFAFLFSLIASISCSKCLVNSSSIISGEYF